MLFAVQSGDQNMALVFSIYSMGIVFSPKRNCVKWPPHDLGTELMEKFHPVMDNSPHPSKQLTLSKPYLTL